MERKDAYNFREWVNEVGFLRMIRGAMYAREMSDRDRPKESEDLALADLLDRLGFSGSNEAVARAALEEASLTRPGKQRIARAKEGRVTTLLRERYRLVCTRCQPGAGATAGARVVLLAARPGDCELCGGSENRVAVDRLCAALLQRGLRRLVVVGGSPNAREALAVLVGSRLELRLVDGASRRTRKEAMVDLQWADLVIIWGGTQLDHKVSTLYTSGAGPAGEKVTTVRHRGIATLVAECLSARGYA